MNQLLEDLQNWVRKEKRIRIGQIHILETGTGLELRQHTDQNSDPARLSTHTGPEAAMELARWDENQAFRPLKSAPTLRAGWRLRLQDMAELRVALDFFYPAALANYRFWRLQSVRPVPLRETVSRQTGMYRITGKLTTEQATELVCATCEPENHCLRVILWGIEEGDAQVDSLPDSKKVPATARPLAFPGEIPVLCVEMCNLLVAEGRKLIKSLPPTAA